ncbi:MAG TPA: cellulase family glycosylhydrolase [Herpetosiphonaceae bacterium]
MKTRSWHGPRFWAILTLIGLLVPLIAACGGVTTAPPEPSTTTAAPAASPSATVTTAPATATAEETAAPSDTASATATAPAETAEPSATSAPQGTAGADNSNIPSQLEYGAAAQLYYTDAARVMKLAEIAGLDWVRQQVPWKDTEVPDRTFGFQELDKVVDTVAASNKKLMLSVAKSPDWATGRPGDNGLPQNKEDFGRFVEELAKRYKGKLHSIEIWNEQNLAVENGGRVTEADAGRYVEMLKEAYTRIKAVDPSIVVVVGALSSTGVTEVNTAVDDITYYKAMYTYNGGEIKNYMDAQGFHPATALNPPDALWPDQPGPGPGWQDSRTHYFRHIEDVRQVMVDNGLADKQIWITEMGWATQNNTPGYEYGNSISFEQQAQYLEGALFRTKTQYQDFVGVVFIWNLNFAVTWGTAGNELHEQASFGILNPDWSPRPAFTAIQGFINAERRGGQ